MASALQNERLRQYVEAEKKVLSGQSYTIGNRQLTRANLAEIRKAIDDLQASGATIDGSEPNRRGNVRRVVFMDG